MASALFLGLFIFYSILWYIETAYFHCLLFLDFAFIKTSIYVRNKISYIKKYRSQLWWISSEGRE